MFRNYLLVFNSKSFLNLRRDRGGCTALPLTPSPHPLRKYLRWLKNHAYLGSITCQSASITKMYYRSQYEVNTTHLSHDIEGGV